MTRTREERIADSARYYLDHKKEMNDYSKRYYRENKERIEACRTAYVEENRDLVSANRKRYREENRFRVAAWKARYQTANNVELAKYLKQWRADFPERHREYQRKDRAARMEAVSDGVIIDYAGEDCVYCGDTATSIDHVFPLSVYLDDRCTNKVPSCKSCNSRKGAMSPWIWFLRLAVKEMKVMRYREMKDYFNE